MVFFQILSLYIYSDRNKKSGLNSLYSQVSTEGPSQNKKELTQAVLRERESVLTSSFRLGGVDVNDILIDKISQTPVGGRGHKFPIFSVARWRKSLIAGAARAELFKAFPVDLDGRFLQALSRKIGQKQCGFAVSERILF